MFNRRLVNISIALFLVFATKAAQAVEEGKETNEITNEITDEITKEEANGGAVTPPHPESSKISTDASNTQLTLFNQRNVHIWQRYVRGFRRDHNFSISLGGTSGAWSVDRLGTVFGEDIESTGGFVKARYSFHLPVYRGFGYLLGSSVGYHFESPDKTLNVIPVSSVQYPGVSLGAVMNLTPGVRLLFLVDYYLERFEDFAERDGLSSREDGTPDDPEISVNMSSLDFVLAVDVFLTLNWGLRIESHQRTTKYERPKESFSHPTNAALSKKDRWFGVGAVYNLL
jgi:hypothetical protein